MGDKSSEKYGRIVSIFTQKGKEISRKERKVDSH